MTRIFVDCTQTYASSDYRGIPRVVRNIIKYGSKLDDTKVEYIAIIIDEGKFKTLPLEILFNQQRNQEVNNKYFRYLYNLYMSMINFICTLLPFTSVRKFMLASAGEPGLAFLISNYLIRFVRDLKKILNPVSTQKTTLLPTKFKKGETILFPDSVWSYNSEQAIKAAKKDGVITLFLCHDIIPITHSNLCPSTALSFKNWIDNNISLFDGIIANSEYTKKSLIQYLTLTGKTDFINHTKWASFRLGSNLNDEIETKEINKSEFLPFIDKEFYLMVSAIEPRKNHQEILKTFEILWQTGANINLVWVGKWTWHCEELRQYVLEHDEFCKRFWVFNYLTENELISVYKQAKALIFPSITEGFGLPIAEALHYKLPVILSDIPIHHEVAGGDALYFKLNDMLSLTELINGIHSKSISLKSSNKPTIDWNESIKELTSSIIQMSSTL